MNEIIKQTDIDRLIDKLKDKDSIIERDSIIESLEKHIENLECVIASKHKIMERLAENQDEPEGESCYPPICEKQTDSEKSSGIDYTSPLLSEEQLLYNNIQNTTKSLNLETSDRDTVRENELILEQLLHMNQYLATLQKRIRWLSET